MNFSSKKQKWQQNNEKDRKSWAKIKKNVKNLFTNVIRYGNMMTDAKQNVQQMLKTDHKSKQIDGRLRL